MKKWFPRYAGRLNTLMASVVNGGLGLIDIANDTKKLHRSWLPYIIKKKESDSPFHFIFQNCITTLWTEDRQLKFLKHKCFTSIFDFTKNWSGLSKSISSKYWLNAPPAHYTYLQHVLNSIKYLKFQNKKLLINDVKAKDLYFSDREIDISDVQLRDFGIGLEKIKFFYPRMSKKDRKEANYGTALRSVRKKLALAKKSRFRVKAFWYDATHNSLPVCYSSEACQLCGEVIHATHFTADCKSLTKIWHPETSFLLWMSHVDIKHSSTHAVKWKFILGME